MMKFFDTILRGSVCIMAIYLLAKVIDNIPNRVDGDKPSMVATDASKPIELTGEPKLAAMASQPDAPAPKHGLKDRLSRFNVLRAKVLPTDEEAVEKQRLLSHLKTVQWVESQLVVAPTVGQESFKQRLSMIDFLEEALSWQDNPIRGELLDSMERVLQTNNLGSGSKEEKRLAIGDKIELFAILAEEDPDRARRLLERTKDAQLRDTFNYAIKRLALKSKLAEESP